jgi:hypothetical protein
MRHFFTRGTTKGKPGKNTWTDVIGYAHSKDDRGRPKEVVLTSFGVGMAGQEEAQRLVDLLNQALENFYKRDTK